MISPPTAGQLTGDPKQDVQILSKWIEQLSYAVNGNVSFGSTTSNTDGEMNIEGWKASGTSPVGANTEFAVTHNLGRVPFGFIVLSVSVAATIYQDLGGTAWSATTAYFKASAASVAYVIFLV